MSRHMFKERRLDLIKEDCDQFYVDRSPRIGSRSD